MQKEGKMLKKNKICGLYIRRSNKGSKYMSGKIPEELIHTDKYGNHYIPVKGTSVYFNVFKNVYKTGNIHPDYMAYFSYSEKKKPEEDDED